eukprot:Pompholyxophrys_punicea_v1_NODE_655_length_1515_cov_8.613434.p1 type:complete len:188 gc:universal NODE_655_length_1515_cov_8.613434:1216-653(-)
MDCSAEQYEKYQHDLNLIEGNCGESLKQYFDENPQLGEIWKNRKIFVDGVIDAWSRDTPASGQNNLKYGARFNPLLIRIALAVYSRSPAAYRAIKNFQILPLPSENTLKAYVRTYNHGAGVDSYAPVLKKFVERFEEIMKEKKIKEPIKDLWVIFDEMKVCNGIIWNAADNSVIGYAVSEEENVRIF